MFLSILKIIFDFKILFINLLILLGFFYYMLNFVDKVHFRERFRRYGNILTKIIIKFLYQKFDIIHVNKILRYTNYLFRPLNVILETITGFFEGIENNDPIILLAENFNKDENNIVSDKMEYVVINYIYEKPNNTNINTNIDTNINTNNIELLNDFDKIDILDEEHKLNNDNIKNVHHHGYHNNNNHNDIKDDQYDESDVLSESDELISRDKESNSETNSETNSDLDLESDHSVKKIEKKESIFGEKNPKRKIRLARRRR